MSTPRGWGVIRRRWTPWRVVLTLALIGGAGSACTAETPPAAEPTPAPKLQVAITVDDVPLHLDLPPDDTRLGVTQRVVTALQGSGVPAIGFVNGGFVYNQDTRDALDLWAKNYPIGNHTWTHENVDKFSISSYQRQITRNEAILKEKSLDGDWHWFRYPFVNEGTKTFKRKSVRTFLDRRGYKIAAVTLDSTDYAYNEHYATCVAKHDRDGVAALEDDLLEAVRYNTLASQQMSQALFGRQVPVVLLIHNGAIDARVLPRILEMFRVMGYEFIPLSQAQSDPAYAADNDPGKQPRPESFEGQMRAKGMTPPPVREPAVDLDTICG